MKNLAIVLAVAVMALTGAQDVNAGTPVTAHVTADNHYGVYTGDISGGGLTFHGRNEATWFGSPGIYNWSVAETLSFSMNIGEYVYIASWDNQLVGGVLGEFETFAGSFFTGSQWEAGVSTVTGLTEGSALPSTGVVATEILAIQTDGTWVPAYATDANSAPWHGEAIIPNVSPSAVWMWYGEYSSRPSGGLHIFRSTLGLEETSTDETSWGGVKKLFQ